MGTRDGAGSPVPFLHGVAQADDADRMVRHRQGQFRVIRRQSPGPIHVSRSRLRRLNGHGPNRLGPAPQRSRAKSSSSEPPFAVSLEPNPVLVSPSIIPPKGIMWTYCPCRFSPTPPSGQGVPVPLPSISCPSPPSSATGRLFSVSTRPVRGARPGLPESRCKQRCGHPSCNMFQLLRPFNVAFPGRGFQAKSVGGGTSSEISPEDMRRHLVSGFPSACPSRRVLPPVTWLVWSGDP